MALSADDTLGPYRILAPIGAGGMGSVYKAHDTRLMRDVAIKVSSARFSERFEREARAIAALNHPNICTLHDIGPNYLVMEYVEGRSPKGPLPLDQAVRIAAQIAAALEAAHTKGIIHRDLKPGNIMIKADGAVKVLDFGLAKMTRSESIQPDDPTMTLSLTETGAILGTAAYMAPEQAEGKPIDKRVDIWAFGVVLHELLSGERLFKAATAQETLAQVLTKTPDLSRVAVEAHPLLRRCLERDPNRRLRDIGDAMPLLEQTPVAATASVRRSWLWPSLAATAVLAAFALAFVHFRETPAAPPALVRFRIPFPAGLDGIGGEVLSEALGALASEGSLTTLGYSASRKTTIDVTSLIVPQASIRGLNMFAQPKAAVAEAWSVIVSLLKSGAIKPIVAKRFPLTEAAEALRYLIEGRPFGRVILTI